MTTNGSRSFSQWVFRIVLFAAGIRLAFWLLAPLWPYLVTALIVFAAVRFVVWHRDRW